MVGQSKWLGWVGLLFIVLGVVQAQPELAWRVTGVETAVFPQVNLRLQTSDSQGRPFPNLDGLTISENNVAITDWIATAVSAGVDVTFVIDANPTFEQVDDGDGVTRQAKVEESINRFAALFMGAQDSVSIVVPAIGGVDGTFLLEAETNPAAVQAAVARFEPGELAPTPLQAMLSLALARASERENGRFQAILLFTDGASLQAQLDFATLVAQAQTANVAIYSAILGARADANEVANVEQLALPTRALYQHMPQAEATDDIYAIWQAQQEQWQLAYQSEQQRSGQHQIMLSWEGGMPLTAVYEVAFAPPELALSVPDSLIRRVGEAADSPLASLQPIEQPVELVVRWPDGAPRPFVEAQLFVNGQPVAAPFSDGVFLWNIQEVSAGPYRLVAELVDAFGERATSEPLLVQVRLERPLPLAVESAQPEPQPPSLFGLSLERTLLLLGGVALLGLLLFFLRWRMGARVSTVQDEVEEGKTAVFPGTTARSDSRHRLLLACLDEAANVGPFVLSKEVVTIGRDPQYAQIVIADRSISRLHARIKKEHHGYWLYDEGSAAGTFVDFERVGLIPQPLTDLVVVQFGRVAFRCYLRSPAEIENWTTEGVQTGLTDTQNDDLVAG